MVITVLGAALCAPAAFARERRHPLEPQAEARHTPRPAAGGADTGAGTGLTYLLEDAVICTDDGVCVERGRLDVLPPLVMLAPQPVPVTTATSPRHPDAASGMPVVPQHTPTPFQHGAGAVAAAHNANRANSEPMPILIEFSAGVQKLPDIDSFLRSHEKQRSAAPAGTRSQHTPHAQPAPRLQPPAAAPGPAPADVPALVSAAVVAMLAGVAAGTAAWYAQGWSAGKLARDAWDPRPRDSAGGPGSPQLVQLPRPVHVPPASTQQRRSTSMAASGVSTTSSAASQASGPREALRQAAPAAEVSHLG